MELWTFRKYEKPFLATDSIRFDDATGELLVDGGGSEYVIEHEGGSGEHIAARLQTLQSPSAALWDELRGNPGVGAYSLLLEQMDHLGLVQDAARSSTVSGESGHYRSAARRAADGLLGDVGASERATLRGHALTVRSHAVRLLRELAADILPGRIPEGDAARRPAEAFAIDNFYLQALVLQLWYFRRSAPLSLLCASLALDQVAAALGEASDGTSELAEMLLDELVGGVYEQRSVDAHLACFRSFLSRSTGSGAARRCRSAFRPSGRSSGIDFMIAAESVALDGIRQLGTPRFLVAIKKPGAPQSLAQGCYLEQYHVTCRFVEILAPMMAKRLLPPLRKRMTKYYAEEVGHEAFELSSCRALGITEEEADQRLPLPLHVAYVDIFTLLSEVAPVGYFVSLFITEGLLGVEPPIDEPMRQLTGMGTNFEEVAGKHSALNEAYNHTSLSRLFMADVPSVGPATQLRALDYMLFLLELNHRAWDDLLEYYGEGGPWQYERLEQEVRCS